MTVLNGKEDKSFLLLNTLYIPSLCTNLLSVAKIVDKGYSVVFDQTCAKIKDKNENIKLIAKRQGDLFFVDSEPNVANVVENAKSDENKWHVRLVYLNNKDLRSMMQNESVTGLNFKLDSEQSPCNTCVASKITREPFPKKSQGTSTSLEIVHTDLCGPMRTQSIGGAYGNTNWIKNQGCTIRQRTRIR